MKAIRAQDELLVKLWGKIQGDPHYRDKTTLFLTNDHGYHKDGIREGFAEHGDDCEGCRHIMLFVVGPDIKKGAVVDRVAYQRDIAPTVGELLGFQTPLAHGAVLKDSLVKHLRLNRKEAKTEIAEQATEIYRRANRDVVRDLADGVLESRAAKLDSLKGGPSTAMLLWGMLSAFDKTRDERYLSFVRSWADKNLEASAQGAAYAGLVLSELTYRLPLSEPRSTSSCAKTRPF